VRRRVPLSLLATLAAAGALAGAPAAACGDGPAALDEAAVTRAIVAIRSCLPESWEVVEIDWEAVPFGWTGEPACVFVRCEDTVIRFRHPEEDFPYHPFYKLWILPPCWQGRMEVASIEPSSPQALYLGENASFRVLYRTLGRNSWPEGVGLLASALGLDPYPLSHSPQHSLDIGAMQRLYQRLDTAGRLVRFQQQIYGIAELPNLIYLELLTWEERGAGGGKDPTFLGTLAETETRVLTREVLAAFPQKRALYLRRVTRNSFSDVLVANPACLAPAP
jgi:hypothetical protein